MQKAMITIVFLAILSVVQSALILSTASAEQKGVTLRAYGPGGPAPAMRDAAKAFGEKKGIKVEIKAGPASNWKDQALKDADMIFSGAEFMMTDFAQKALPGLIDTSTIRTLYLRPSAILVRPGNPKSIKGVKDLTRPGLKILVVQGAGQVGMWEDVAGRTGDAKLVDGVRRNIAFFAPNSAEAKKIWSRDPSVVDAWLIWNIWQKANPTAADLVSTEPENTIYRSCGIAVTNRSPHKASVKEFVDFLTSDQGKDIFSKWGWTVR
jgi:accessory colonization factor AcfC